MDYYLAFSLAPKVGPKRFLRIKEHFGNLEKAWRADADEFSEIEFGERLFSLFDAFRKSFSYFKYSQFLSKNSIQFISQKNELYPRDLVLLPDPPIGIFVRGKVSLLKKRPAYGIVGTRKMSAYGRKITHSISFDLAKYGNVVVSGMALGVDACAHRAALEASGATVAVLGNGVDEAFPRENRQLYKEIINFGGAVVSEYPPGTPASKGSFPARNRIIAGLSDGVVVTEAGSGSGSLITAKYARKMNKSVYAVPGMVGTFGARGTHELLRGGAKFIEQAEDIFGKAKKEKKDIKKRISELNFDESDRKVLFALAGEALDVDDLSEKISISTSKLIIILSGLEIQGYVKRDGVGKFVCAI